MRYLIVLVLLSTKLMAADNAVIKNIVDAANLADVNPQLLLAVCFVESSYRSNLKPHMDGHTESHGICQIKLETAQNMDKVYKLHIKATKQRLQNPFVNAFYAAKFIRYQLYRYDGDMRKAVESYNKGSAVSGGKGTYVNKVFRALVAQNN